MKKMLRSICAGVCLVILASSALLAQENRERDYEIALTKGQYAIETGDYRAAVGLLEQALKLKPGDRDARISLGIALGRAGELERAREVLKQAADADPKDGRARYELALVTAQQGDREVARTLMAEALSLSTDAALSAAARGALGGAPSSDKPALQLTVGMQYDSNVILEQDNPIAPSSENKADWRGVAIVQGTMPFLTTEKHGAEAGYQFYQSLHLRLEDYNVQQHAARIGGHAALSGNTRVDLDYTFIYSFLGAEHYSTTHRISPRITAGLTDSSVTEVHGVYEGKRYFNTPLFTALTEKNGTHAALGLTHTLQIGPKSGLSFDYTYDRDSTERDYWDYTGHRVAVSCLVERGAYRLFLGASYHDRSYDGAPPGGSEKRHDGAQELSLRISRTYGKRITASLSDSFTFNDSNLGQYEYKRNILGLFMEMKL